MSADNLRVLRSEQSSGNMPGLKEVAELKDHLKHVVSNILAIFCRDTDYAFQSPLSMVRDKKPGRKRIRRRSSWKDTLKGFASGGEVDDEDNKHAYSTAPMRIPSKSLSLRAMPGMLGADEGSLADAESDDEDFNERKEEDRPIQARILYKYPNGGSDLPKSNSALEKQQQELSIAVAEANSQAVRASSGNHSPEPTNSKAKESVGTRLTMTSRTGYFQDRIISPSLVCERLSAICIL